MKTVPGVTCLVVLLAAAHLPAQDMPLAQLLIADEGWELVGERYTFTEAPAVDGQGTVYFADVPDSKIYKIDATGKPVVWIENSERTSGLMFGPNELLYGCQSGARRIVAYDTAGHAQVIADDVDCNDLVVNRVGGIYFTDPKNHQVWHIDPRGQTRLVDTGIERPNGIILWADQQTLVVADTAGPHLWAFRVEPDGSLAYKQPFYTCRLVRGETASGADGLAADTQGRIYAATSAGLSVFDTQGRLSGVIAKPQDRTLSNVVLGGPKFDTLYVTSTDKVFRRKTTASGLRYFEPAAR